MVWLTCLLLLAAQTARGGEALDAFFRQMETQTLQADFVLTVSEDAAQPMNYPGTITMRGERFALAMFDMEAAYDGSTLYIYSESTDELTLSTPTQQELTEANPFLYARALADVCTVSERAAQDGQSTTIVLTPKNQSAGIQKFTLVVKNHVPQKVTVKEGSKQTVLVLKNAAFLPAAGGTFRLEQPDAFVNDLR